MPVIQVLFEHTSDSQVCLWQIGNACDSSQGKDTCALQVGSICLKLGKMTNNQAEYYGLLAGLEACKAMGIKRISVLGDSQLVIKQVTWSNCTEQG